MTLPKRILRGIPPLGTCGHTEGACTCDFFEFDPDATRAVIADAEESYLEFLENKYKERLED